MQSSVLAWAMGCILAAACTLVVPLMKHPLNSGIWTRRAGIVSLTFGIAVWALRAATPMAALQGAMVCLLVTLGAGRLPGAPVVQSGFAPLLCLVVLTYSAGKIARTHRKRGALELDRAAQAEERRGRNASQIAANIGLAGFIVVANAVGAFEMHHAASAMLLAAFAEATADTVSSEIGSEFGGRPWLLTTLQRVQPGTDGAISLIGTLTGILAAALVVAVGVWALGEDWRTGFVAFAGGVCGLFFDSLLGATVERKGWLGNDLVNFSSTLIAALTAFALCLAGS